MATFDHRKYKPAPQVRIKNRKWPDNIINKAPIWASVDLRDGNQALENPMSPEQKLRFFHMLVKTGFKHIEVGFPGASQTDYDFIRVLIENELIPHDVCIQVLTQSRAHIIDKTFEAIKGAKNVTIHLYNSTSKTQRESVFGLDKQGIIDIAVSGAKQIADSTKKYPDTSFRFQYSPESFSATEPDFAVEICHQVFKVWHNKTEHKTIYNLPATVEVSTPNVYADQIEYFCQNLPQRDQVIVSVHTHNDRGCAVAAAELAVMAGADRVEGAILGNGERTGNMDLITMAMNLYTQGVDPELNFEHMSAVVECAKECTDLPVHPRHPYVGELVYTAFSGSHQDAIKKCLTQQTDKPHWDVAYLPIDPKDLGRNYEEIIRVNSQSGKAGAAFILKEQYGIQLPKWLAADFSVQVQKFCESSGKEISAEQIYQLFNTHYLGSQNTIKVQDYQYEEGQIRVNLSNGTSMVGEGQGPIEAACNALNQSSSDTLDIDDYQEYAINAGQQAEAIAFIKARRNNQPCFGVSIDKDITKCALQALIDVSRKPTTDHFVGNQASKTALPC